MRLKNILLSGLFLLSACAPSGVDQATVIAQLTPYTTSTSVVSIPTEVPTTAPQPTSTPAPTATPLVHVVALGETISSIALRYGLDMGAVLAANPELNPNALLVGTEVFVPVGNTEAQIGTVSEPLGLDVGTPVCVPTFEEGIWCFVQVTNPLEQAATVVIVSISLTEPGGEEVGQMNVPLLLNKIEPGQTIPVVAYFAPPASADFLSSASLISALPIPESGRSFLPAIVANETVDLIGQTARVSGEVEISGKAGEQVVLRVAAMAFDVSGQLVGARRTETEITLEPGDAVDFNINLYSSGADIASVQILAEANQDDQ